MNTHSVRAKLLDLGKILFDVIPTLMPVVFDQITFSIVVIVHAPNEKALAGIRFYEVLSIWADCNSNQRVAA